MSRSGLGVLLLFFVGNVPPYLQAPSCDAQMDHTRNQGEEIQAANVLAVSGAELVAEERNRY
jgi:hypothetical protein